MPWKLNLRLPVVPAVPPEPTGADAAAAVCVPPLRGQSEEDALIFCVPGDRPDAAALHARYLDDVSRYVSRRVTNREEAEDITVEVFTAAFQGLPRFKGQCDPRLWLLGIARRKIADSLRQRQRRRETLTSEMTEHAAEADDLISGDTTAGPAILAEQREARQAVRRLLQGLKEEQREALLLKYVEGLSINEMAVVMGRSPAAVNSLLQRARATVFRQGQDYFGTAAAESEVTP